MKGIIVALLVGLLVMIGPVVAIGTIDFEAETEYVLDDEDFSTTLTLGTAAGPFEFELEYSNVFEPDIDELSAEVCFSTGPLELTYGRDFFAETDLLDAEISFSKGPFELAYEIELLDGDSGTITLTFSHSFGEGEPT